METLKGYAERFTKNLDVLFGIMGLILGLFIISLYYTVHLDQRSIGVAILSSCLIYILFKSRFENETALSAEKDKIKTILNFSFYLIFLVAVLIFSMNLYFRPISYFILICVLAGIVAAQILYIGEGDRVTSILVQIFLLSILIRVGIFYNFPSLMGYDAYFHASMAREITDTGYVAPIQLSSKYFYYPLAHIFISITQLMGKIDVKDAIFYSIGLASVFSTVGIYLIGKKLEGPQMGLLATLLININNQNIVSGIANITSGSLVLCYFIIMIYAIYSGKENLRFTAFVLFITILMVITHQLTTFVVFLALATMYVGKHLHNTLFKSLSIRTTGFNYMLFFAISMQTYWMFTFVNPDTSFLQMVLKPLIEVLQSGAGYSGAELTTGTSANKKLVEMLLLQISYLALPFFAIGGVLAWFSRDNIKKINKFSISLVVIVLYGLAYGIPLLGMRNFLTSRWFPLIAVFLVLVAASFMLKLASLSNSKKVKIPAIFIIVLLFSFFMITTPGINKDNPLVAKETTVRNQFKYIEIQAIETISGKYTDQIVLDSPYDSCIFYRNQGFDPNNITTFNTENVKAREIEGNPLVLLRKSTLIEPVSINDPERYGVDVVEPLSKEFFNRFEAQDYALVYNNKDVVAYSKERKKARI